MTADAAAIGSRRAGRCRAASSGHRRRRRLVVPAALMNAARSAARPRRGFSAAGRKPVTASPPRPACWRAVVSAELRVGRGSVLGPDTTRRARWWELGLKCGHKTQRTVRYKRSDDPQRGGTQRRDIGDVLPAPKRVRCELCEADAARREDADGAN